MLKFDNPRVERQSTECCRYTHVHSAHQLAGSGGTVFTGKEGKRTAALECHLHSTVTFLHMTVRDRHTQTERERLVSTCSPACTAEIM